MSDCSPNAWAVPKLAGLPHFDGADELVVDALVAPDRVSTVRAVRVRQAPGAVFVRREECELALEYRGWPCCDFRCSACGKVHNAPRPNAFCPRCGAVVTNVVRTDARGAGERGDEMMEIDADMAYYVNEHGEMPERVVVHDESGELPDAYYRRVHGPREQVEVKEVDA